MSNTNIQLRKSGVTGNVPDSLAYGELALNYADGKLYYKNGDGVITYISSGATTNSFATINSNSSLVIATSNTDILSFGGANGISINTNTVSKVITIDGRVLQNRLIHLEEWGLAQNDIVSVINSTAFEALTKSQVAYNRANSGIDLAQSAYDYANTISGGATPVSVNYLAIEKQLYTANASQTNFYVNYSPPFVTVVINGSTIDASEYSTATANTVILNNPASAGDIVDITGFNNVNSNTVSFGGGSGTDQWVRDTANSAAANTIITQGVDAWQNTQITAVNNFAQGAYTKANNAQSTIDYNVGLIGTTYTLANNANNLAQSAYTTATGAYNTANGANGLAAGAFDKANNALPLTGGNISGTITVGQDVIITGNLYLSGNTTTISTNNITLNDSIIYLANENAGNTVDIGVVGHFYQNKYQHTGVIRNHLTGNWVFFSNVSTEPTTVVNFAEANLVYDSITTGGVITPTATINGKDWQSVNNTQNTNITAVNNYAAGAYGVANVLVGINTTQNTRLDLIETTNTNQNTSIGIIQGVDTWQNNQITLVNQFTQSAYNQANGANGLAAGSYAAANTNATNITAVNGYATSAYATANGANGLAAGAYNKANNALANTTGTFAGDLTTTGNIIISTSTSSYSVGTGSLRVNGGVGVTGNVYADKIYVNGLYWASNGNVISTSSGTTSTNQFNIFKYIATNGQTTFSGPDSASVSLNYTAGAIIVTLNGLTLKPGSDYTATDGTSIILTVAADLNDELNIYGFTSTTVNTSNTLSVFAYTASAMQTSFGGVDTNGNSLSYVPGALFTTLNGITLRNGVDYTAANGSYINLTFNAAANDEVVVYTFGAFNVANVSSLTSTGTSNVTITSANSVVISANSGIIDASSATGGVILPHGTTAQRPANPVSGTMRFNTSNNVTEIYSGTSWVTITTQFYAFTYLIVAGGGGGSSGAGGAGGAITGTTSSIASGTTYAITVGAGGSGVTDSGPSGNASQGSNSTLASIGTSIGGGGGGNWASAGASGGSGGGAGNRAVNSGGSATSGQGNIGGNCNGTNVSDAGGGGGGAGAAGQTGSNGNARGGNGGIGISVFGNYYAGGGGGGGRQTGAPNISTGGAGGGGNGSGGTGLGASGTTNTGGGAGGGGFSDSGSYYGGGPGGSGVVIIQYEGSQKGTGGTITTSGGYTYHTFTTSGTFTT